MKAAIYHYGEFRGVENVSREALAELSELEDKAIMGFNLRKQDREKAFFAAPSYVDEGADGIAVKYAYAITKKGRD